MTETTSRSQLRRRQAGWGGSGGERSAAVVRGTVDSTVRFAPVPPAIANACISVQRNYVVRR